MSQQVLSTSYAQPPGLFAELRETWVSALTRPSGTTFEEIALAAGTSSRQAYILVFLSATLGLLFQVIISTIFGIGLPAEAFGRDATLPASALGAYAFLVFLFSMLAGLLAVFALWLGARISHLMARLVGGSGSIVGLENAFAAYLVPITLITSVLGALPAVNYSILPLWLYAVLLTFLAVGGVERIGLVKAIFAGLFTVLLFVLVRFLMSFTVTAAYSLLTLNFSGLTVSLMINTLSQVIPLIVGVTVGIVILELALYALLGRVLRSRYALPYTLLAPATIAILLFTIYPFLFNVLLSFSDLRRDTFSCYSPIALGECQLDHIYGVDYAQKNFRAVFIQQRPRRADVEYGALLREPYSNALNQRLQWSEVNGWGRLLSTEASTFPVLFGRTLIWTATNVVFHVLIGMILALVLNQKIRFRGLYRALIIVPWAIPQVIVALSWRQEFHAQYGFVNILLNAIGITGPSWLDEPLPAFVAVTFVNIWLGIPFYMVILIGGLQSISPDYYEAAQMDGASRWQRFRFITMPLLQPILAPMITLDVIWTFNQFNVIYLITGGGPQESTNILVTALFNAAFGPAASLRLGFASAFSIVIFALLFCFAVFWIWSSGGLKDIYNK